MLFIGVTKRAKIPPIERPSAMIAENGTCFDGEFKAYLYWPLAAIMIAISAASYLAGMYFASS